MQLAGEYTLEWPLWDAAEGDEDEVDLDALVLSEALQAELRRWALGYASPVHEPQITSTDSFAGWVAEGRDLAKRLKNELGQEFRVSYFDALSAEIEDV